MSILFSLKKFISHIFYPSGLIFLLLILIFFYVILDKRRGRRRALLLAVIIIYYFSSTPFLPYLLLKHLESKYKIPSIEKIKEAKAIVVLTAKVFTNPSLSLEERFSRESLVRLLKGIELKKEFPEKPLVIIGGNFLSEDKKGAYYFKKFAERFGCNAVAIDTPFDTITSAKVFKNWLKAHNSTNEEFLLLTSAYHLPRSMYLFKHFGLNPIPYPTNYDYKLCDTPFSFFKLLPDPYYLRLTDIAVHEYLGLLFYKIKFFLEKHF